MAVDQLVEPTRFQRFRLTPWWVQVLVIFAASRVVTTIIMLAFAAAQQPNFETGAHPGYVDFAGIWDSRWYALASQSGWPAVLPVSGGHVQQNTWAFLPAYPVVLAVLTRITAAPVAVIAVLVSVAFAAGAALMVFRLLRLVMGESQAMFAVVLFCAAPLSPILQVGYAESMYLFFLATALYFLVRRRYWMLLPVVAVMDFTRPGGIAFTLALALHIVYRWVRRSREPFERREVLASVIVTILTGLLGVAWPLIAWAVTGSLTAYTDTELAWRKDYIGYQQLFPFTPWIQGANWWIPHLGWIVLIIVLVLFGMLMRSSLVRQLAPDLRFWSLSYALYLLAVFFPQSSTFRLLMPMFPLLGALAIPRSRTYRVVVVSACVLGQVWWMYIGWWINGYDWTPP